MKGHNRFILCPATVMEALQEYFDKRLTEEHHVKVHTYTIASSDRGTGCPSLEVSTIEPSETEVR